MKVLIVATALIASVSAFCFHQYGGIGEYHKACEASVGKILNCFFLALFYLTTLEMEACYARCNCWDDFPNMGGQITHEVDAWCFQDACWCSYNQNLCPFGTLKTDPWCCITTGFTCDQWDCDTSGNCTHIDPMQ